MRTVLTFKKWFEQNDNNPLITWHNDIPTYHRGLVKSNHLFPGYVHVYDPEYYGEKDRNRRVFHDPHGEVGYALLPHWEHDEKADLWKPHDSGRIEIAGVYNNGGERTKGWGAHAIQHAARQGGNYLEAFEGNEEFSLPLYYHRHLGVQPIGYLPWDDQYAPEGWDYAKKGRPGIVMMDVPKHGMADLDRWLQTDHKRESFKEFQERLRELKRRAGVKMENKQHDPNKHRDHCCSEEEYDKLVSGVDELHFNSQLDEPFIKESKENKE
jgi:hypothetical protein